LGTKEEFENLVSWLLVYLHMHLIVRKWWNRMILH